MIVSEAIKFISEDYGVIACLPVHGNQDYLTVGKELSNIGPLIYVIGFLTDKGIFLDAYEALDEAMRCGQISANDSHGYEMILSGRLKREDLW